MSLPSESAFQEALRLLESSHLLHAMPCLEGISLSQADVLDLLVSLDDEREEISSRLENHPTLKWFEDQRAFRLALEGKRSRDIQSQLNEKTKRIAVYRQVAHVLIRQATKPQVIVKAHRRHRSDAEIQADIDHLNSEPQQLRRLRSRLMLHLALPQLDRYHLAIRAVHDYHYTSHHENFYLEARRIRQALMRSLAAIETLREASQLPLVGGAISRHSLDVLKRRVLALSDPVVEELFPIRRRDATRRERVLVMDLSVGSNSLFPDSSSEPTEPENGVRALRCKDGTVLQMRPGSVLRYFSASQVSHLLNLDGIEFYLEPRTVERLVARLRLARNTTLKLIYPGR